LDCGVVERAAAETVARRAIEDGQYAGPGRGAGGVEGLLAGYPAGLVDAAQVFLHEVILAGKVLVERAFRHVSVFGQPLHPGGVDPLAVKQGCRGGEDPLARSATTVTGRPGGGHACSTHCSKHTDWFTFGPARTAALASGWEASITTGGLPSLSATATTPPAAVRI